MTSDLDESGRYSVVYDVLEACTNEELWPLVETLEQSPLSVLRISRAYHRHNPDHTCYIDQIGDEIRRLGQVALGITDGSGPSYGAIIAGFCKKLSVSQATADVSITESDLLNLFLKQRFIFIAHLDQQSAIDSARNAAVEAAGGLLSSAVWKPLASCLLQIAYLRQKLRMDGRISSPGSAPASSLLSKSNSADNTHASELVISNDGGDSLLTVVGLPYPDELGWKVTRKGDPLLHALGPIFEAIQPLISAKELLASGSYMRVTMPPGAQLIKKVDHSGWIGTFRQAGDSRFAGQAVLNPVNLASLATPLIFLTLASAMIEQKRFDDLQRAISEVRVIAEGISIFQKNERHAALTGSIRYFDQVAVSVWGGETSDEVLHSIERHEVDLVRIQDHLIADIHCQIELLQKTNNESRFGSGKFINAIKEQQDNLEKLYRETLLCIRARACGWQLLSAFPGRELRKEARLQDILKSLSIFEARGQVVIDFDKLIRGKVQSISSNEIKSSLLRDEENLFQRLSIDCTQIQKDIQSFGRSLAEQEQPISVDFKIEDGHIVASRPH